MTARGEALAYYLAHVDDDTDQCLLWPFSVRSGYGQLTINGHKYGVHILACEQHYGPMPRPGMFAIHAPVICHNKHCFNWRHLRWGAPSENSADMTLDGTTTVGERSGRAKLTWAQVFELRALYAAGGVSQRALAARYGVTLSVVNLIIRQLRWKDPA
jgi:hypothetical protein